MNFRENEVVEVVAPAATHQRGRWLNRFMMLVVVSVIFMVGVGVGDGRITPFFMRTKPVASDLPSKLDYSSVNQVYQSLKDNYDGKVSAGQLTDGLKHGLATATKDPYTVYFTSAEAKSFNNELNNSFSGIGAQLELDSAGNLQVMSPLSGQPAEKAGLRALDIIVSINGASTSGVSVDEAVTKIRGPKGTKVTLQVVRNKTEPLTVTITRQDITLPSVTTKTLEGNIGYMQINKFANDTTDLTQKAATQFANSHVKGIILDMRNDPGGLLEAAVKVSSLWVPEGKTILQEKRGTEVVQNYFGLGSNTLGGIPTVVLINEGSASASEITAGALHDNKAAYLIGTKSYGKGVVQQLINFGDGSQLKVTVASWYRPNGQNINKKGITPDQVVKLSDADIKAGNDTQLQAAQAYLNK
ncbi:MAG: S41 family peptidase [Candidatus Saccharibacteria bacterium]